MELEAVQTPPDTTRSNGASTGNEDNPAPIEHLIGAQKRTECLSCGTVRVGRFCQNCGQKYLDAPMTYWTLGKAFVDRVLDLDQGLLYTIRRLAVDPGEVSLEYIKGRQRPYANPLAYMVIATAVYIGLFSLTEDVVQSVTRATLEPYFSNSDEAYAVVVDQVLKPYASILFILSCLPMAYVLRKLFARTAEYTTAETLIMVLFCTGQATLYTGICQLLVVLLPNATGVMIAQMSTLLLFPMIGHGAYGFYRRTAGDAVLGFAGSVVGYVLTILMFLVIGGVIGVILAVLHSVG